MGIIFLIFAHSLIFKPVNVKHSFLSLFRQKRRTLMALTAIVIGGVSIFIFGGFVKYAFWSLREMTIRSRIGHIQIYKKGFLESGSTNALKYGISNYNHIRDLMLSDPEIVQNIKTITGQIEFAGIISNYEKGTSSNFVGLGIEPASSVLLGSLDIITLGSDLSRFDNDGAVIGRGLSQSLGTKYDEYNDILIINQYGGQNAMSVRVRGIFQSGIKSYDDIILKLPLKVAQNLLETTDVSKMIILLNDTDMTDQIAGRLRQMIKQYNLDIEMTTWPQEAVFYKQVVTMYNGIFLFIKIIMTIIVIFFIGNTLMLNVMERIREIGTIRAMGVTRGGIWNIFFLEGFFMGLLGGLISLTAGWLLATALNVQGIPMPPAPGYTRGYIAFIRLEESSDIIWFTFSLALITSFIGSIIPAFKASRMVIVEALRHV